MAIKKKKPTTFEKSSGNVFADIGFANPEREQLKAHLTLQIYRIIKDRHLTQAQAGAILGIKQPHVSALMRSRGVALRDIHADAFYTEADKAKLQRNVEKMYTDSLAPVNLKKRV